MTDKPVLIVEDNPQDEKLTLRALKKLQLANEICVVRDGAEALDYLWRQNAYIDQEGEPLPAVVLLDINLPKLSGVEVLAQLRSRESTRTLPIVMLTSSDEEQDMIDSYQHGANSYVRKPVEAGEFAKAVAQLGVYWLAVNELPKT